METAITNKINKKREEPKVEEIIETLDEIYNHAFGVLDTCGKLIDSAPGKLADRLENMQDTISDEELYKMGGQMKAFDEAHFYPVLANGIIPTWKNGYMQLYVRVKNGYRYETCALNGEILNDNDKRNNGHYINRADRDFIAIDLAHEADEIIEEILNAMETVEKK